MGLLFWRKLWEWETIHHHDLCLHVLGLDVSVNTSKASGIREVRGISLTITSTAWSRIVREL